MIHPRFVNAKESSLTQDYLAKLLTQARKKYKVPAIAVSLMSSQAILLQEIQGVRAIDEPDEATLDDYFHIGSCSKSVLALIAAKLVEQKKISWETRFFDVFSELKGEADSAYHGITLEDLFLCRAGVKAYTNMSVEPLPAYDSSVGDKRLRFIKDLIKQPPASATVDGKFEHLYSNASYTMAAAMLERVAGQRYEELVRNTLTQELGLSVHIGWPNVIDSNQPWGHMITKKNVESFPPEHEYKIPELITPAGDLSMTPRDYAKYTQLHLKGLRGEEDYISSEQFDQIHFGHDAFSPGVANGVWGGKKYSGFDGSGGTFFCRSIIVPESDFALTIMTNAASGTARFEAVDWLTRQIVKKQFNWGWKFWLWW